LLLLLLLLLLDQVCWECYARELSRMCLQEIWCWLQALLGYEATDSRAWLDADKVCSLPAGHASTAALLIRLL
jgi:hypothetical protein